MKKKTSQLIGALFFLAVVLAGARAWAGDIYNLANQFSTSTNSATTTWSFCYQNANILDSNNMPDNTIRNGVYTLMAADTSLQGLTGLNGWADQDPALLRFGTGDGYTPQIMHNITGAPVVNDPNLTWPSNAVSMYLETSTLSVLSWLAPRSGTVNVTYEFASEWLNQGAQEAWFVDHGDQTGNLASGAVADSDTGLQIVTNVAVTAGERINFICEPVTGTAYNNDYVRVIGRISYTDATNVVYDDEAQFDGNENTDTNMWSCRYQAYNDGTLSAPDFSDRNGIYTLLPDNWGVYIGTGTFEGWLRVTYYGSLGTEFPDVEQNQTGSNFVWPGISYFVIPQNQVFMNPDANTVSGVTWLAPSNGIVSITYEFNMLDDDRYAAPDPFNTGTLFFIDKGDAAGNLVSGQIDPNTNDAAFLLDSGRKAISNVSVNAGDRINFLISPIGHRSQNAYAATDGIFAQIEYGPTLTISISGGIVKVTWPGTGTLLQAPALTGPWTTAGTVSPYTTAVSGSPQMFYTLAH